MRVIGLGAAALVAALMIGACGGSHAPKSASVTSSAIPTPELTVAPTQSVPPPPPPPTPVPTPTHNPNLQPFEYDASAAFLPDYGTASQAMPSGLSPSCRLPVYAGLSGSGGFLILPGGQFIADPRSNVLLPSPPPNFTPPPGPGPDLSFQGLTYDHAVSRWLPVQRNKVSPDGKQYAYSRYGANGVYVVDATSGSQMELGADSQWWVLDVEVEGIYAFKWAASGQASAGLWLVPFTGSPRQVTPDGYWQAVGGGAAYGMTTSAVPAGATAILQRLDLKTGQSQPWFEVPGAQWQILGFDVHGSPIVQDYFQGGTQIWIIPGLSQGYVIENNPPFGGGLNFSLVADSHGIWFGGGGGLYLFIPGSGTFVAGYVQGIPAGDCA